MSRSGYSDDYDDASLHLYRGQVASAVRGRRGQAFLRDLVEALDAMPEKRLITDHLVQEGAVCAIGALGVKRGVDMSKLAPDDAEAVGASFNIAEQLAREVVWENDEAGPYYGETPEQRWARMRRWAESLIKAGKVTLPEGAQERPSPQTESLTRADLNSNPPHPQEET